jgi:hypothetical protein
LYRILYAAWHDIKRFTRSRPSPDEPGGYEAGIFDALSWASGDASVIVNKELSEKWLEIIGWPEQYPGTKLDPARLPSKFHPLIPYAQKWVIHDDGVRDTVIRAATNEELEELVSAIDQIGYSVIRDMAFKMQDDRIQEESLTLFTLLELTEMAESLLRDRPDSPTP